jgi:hypothetical protein
MIHVFMYRARLGEQNEDTRSVIGLLYKAMSVGRVLWLGDLAHAVRRVGFGADFSHMRIEV